MATGLRHKNTLLPIALTAAFFLLGLSNINIDGVLTEICFPVLTGPERLLLCGVFGSSSTSYFSAPLLGRYTVSPAANTTDSQWGLFAFIM